MADGKLHGLGTGLEVVASDSDDAGFRQEGELEYPSPFNQSNEPNGDRAPLGPVHNDADDGQPDLYLSSSLLV